MTQYTGWRGDDQYFGLLIGKKYFGGIYDSEAKRPKMFQNLSSITSVKEERNYKILCLIKGEMVSISPAGLGTAFGLP